MMKMLKYAVDFATLAIIYFAWAKAALINGARSADITDVITNTAGGAIGYAAYCGLKPLIKATRKEGGRHGGRIY